MSEFEDSLHRWVLAGVISESQATAIRELEVGSVGGAARTSAPTTSRTGVGVSEVVAYAGAVVALAGVGFLLGTQGQRLGPAGRQVVLGIVALVALVGGLGPWWPLASAVARRARAGVLALAAAAVGIFVGDVVYENGLFAYPVPGCASCPVNVNPAAPWLLGATAGLIVGIAFYLKTRSALLAAGIPAGLVVAASSLDSWVRFHDPVAEAALYVGAGLVCLALTEVAAPQPGLGREVLRWAAVILPVIALLLFANDNHLWMELLAGGLAVAAFAGAVRLASTGFAIAGGVGLLGFVMEVGARHFTGSLGLPVVLIVAGIVLIAVALTLTRLLPRLRAAG